MRTRTIALLGSVAAAMTVSLWGPAVAAAKHDPPPPRSRAEVQAVLAKAPRSETGTPRPIHIILLAGKKDHGRNQHDYPLWQKRWKVLLGGKGPDDEPKVNLFRPEPESGTDAATAGAPGVTVTTAMKWPGKEQLAKADLLVMFSKARWTPETLAALEAFLDRGGGFVIVHAAIWQKSKPLADLVGMAASNQTQYRHGVVDLAITDPSHPITRGFPETVRFMDETYFHFQGDPSRITVLATSRERLAKGKPQTRPEPIFWCRSRGKGRVFACIPGHFTWTFDDPLFRLLMLRGMAWAAGESPFRFGPLAVRGAALGH